MKTVFAAIALAAASTVAFASEATQFDIPSGSLTRTEVRAAIGSPSFAMHLGDATVFADTTTSMRHADRQFVAGLPRTGGRIADSRNYADAASAQPAQDITAARNAHSAPTQTTHR